MPLQGTSKRRIAAAAGIFPLAFCFGSSFAATVRKPLQALGERGEVPHSPPREIGTEISSNHPLVLIEPGDFNRLPALDDDRVPVVYEILAAPMRVAVTGDDHFLEARLVSTLGKLAVHANSLEFEKMIDGLQRELEAASAQDMDEGIRGGINIKASVAALRRIRKNSTRTPSPSGEEESSFQALLDRARFAQLALRAMAPWRPMEHSLEAMDELRGLAEAGVGLGHPIRAEAARDAVAMIWAAAMHFQVSHRRHHDAPYRIAGSPDELHPAVAACFEIANLFMDQILGEGAKELQYLQSAKSYLSRTSPKGLFKMNIQFKSRVAELLKRLEPA